MSKRHTQSNADFGALFRQLLDTRNRYETLRSGGAPFAERSELLDRLHDLRAEMALLRSMS
jgi:hypothetical protein